MRSLLSLSGLALLWLSFAPGTAGAVAAAPDYVPGNNCSVLGTSHMAYNNTGLVICALANDLSPVPTACGPVGSTSECKWKAMSGEVELPQGSYCGLMRCGFSCGGFQTMTCYAFGVVEHIPCNGQNLITHETCGGITSPLSGDYGFPVVNTPYTTPVSCPSNYAKEVINVAPGQIINNNLFNSNYAYVCVKQ